MCCGEPQKRASLVTAEGKVIRANGLRLLPLLRLSRMSSNAPSSKFPLHQKVIVVEDIDPTSTFFSSKHIDTLLLGLL